MKKTAGFTLIELVLAIALSAVLAAALGGVLRGAVGTWRSLRDSARARQRAQTLFGRLGRDLRNSLSFPGETFSGSAHEMVFKTVVGVPKSTGALETVPSVAKVVYCREGTNVVLAQQLYSPAPFADRTGIRIEIPGDIQFAYAYAGGTDGQVRWEDVWVDTDTVPRGVKATLFFRGEKETLRYESVFQIPTGVFRPWKN